MTSVPFQKVCDLILEREFSWGQNIFLLNLWKNVYHKVVVISIGRIVTLNITNENMEDIEEGNLFYMMHACIFSIVNIMITVCSSSEDDDRGHMVD